jgi:hypothetical protein
LAITLCRADLTNERGLEQLNRPAWMTLWWRGVS